MSNPSKEADGYTPSRPRPSRFTFQEVEQFANLFAKMIEGSRLKWWIIAAGLGALAELLHILWLALRYVFRF
jgi:hypothetical protein